MCSWYICGWKINPGFRSVIPGIIDNDTIEKIQTDGFYTNIAWSKIDIEKRYRVAFSVRVDHDPTCMNGIQQTIELLSHVPCDDQLS